MIGKHLVMTNWGWIAALNFDSPEAAKKGVLHFLNKPEDQVGRVVEVDAEPAAFRADETFVNLVRCGKAVDSEMISRPERSWDPTEFLRRPSS